MKLFSKKEDKYSVGRPKLAGEELKKKSVIISCICLVVALALLITGAFELNILKFNTKKLKGTVNTNLCGDDINIIPEDLRYSETNPDGFKDIKFYSAVLSSGLGTSSNSLCSTITKADLEGINRVDAGNPTILDASGIGYLTNLRYLSMRGSNIQNIDLSKNSLLEELYLNGNKISSINLEENINLEKLEIGSNKLKSLDLGNNTKLTRLVVSNNEIENLDLSKNNQISVLYIDNNPFKNVILDNIHQQGYYASLSFSLDGCNEIEILSIKNTNIGHLSLTGTAKIKNIDISNNESLTNFSAKTSVKIGNLLVGNSNNLTSFSISNSDISSIKLSNLPKITELYLGNNNLTNVTISDLPSLVTLDLNRNNLTSIDISNLNNLQRVYLNNNQLTNIDVSDLPSLITLILNDNNLTSIDLSDLTKLSVLCLDNNNLNSIDVSMLFNLGYISIANNNLESVKFTENPTSVFETFDLSNNNLSGNLDLTNLKFNAQHTAIFNLNNNKLTSLRLPGGTYGSDGMYLSNNNLTRVEFTGPVNVGSLYLSNNELTNADISNLIGVQSLFLDNNNLKKIQGLSELSNLQGLTVHNNKLESIDLSGNPNLNIITLQNNPLSNTKYLLKGQSIDYKDMINGDNITYNTDNQNVGTFDGSILNLKEVGQLSVTASNENIISAKLEYLDKCLIDYEKNHEYCDNVNEEDVISPYFYENKVIVYDVLSNNYKVDSNNKTIDVSGLVPDVKYITLTEGFTGEIKGNKYLVKNSNNEVIEEFDILNPGKKEEEVKKVTTTSKGSSKRVIKANKRVTTKKLEDINLTGSFISSLMLNQVKGQDRKLTVTNEDVTLILLGKDIKSIDSNIDISYKVTDVKESEAKDKVEEGIVLEFMNKTTLPGISQIEVNVKDKVKNNADIYRYDNDSLTLIAEDVKVDNNRLAFNTDKLDTYVITNKLKKDVTVKEDKTLIESNDKIKKSNNKCLFVIPIVAIILLIGIGTYIYKKKITRK